MSLQRIRFTRRQPDPLFTAGRAVNTTPGLCGPDHFIRDEPACGRDELQAVGNLYNSRDRGFTFIPSVFSPESQNTCRYTLQIMPIFKALLSVHSDASVDRK